MLTNTDSIQQLYLAYLQRPADSAGLVYWVHALETGTTLSSIREQFAKQAEFQNLIAGKSHAQIVDTLYLNVFGRHADQAGLTSYTDVLDRNQASVEFVVSDIVNGAADDDAAIFANKVVAAELFTTALGIDPINIIGYPQDPTAGKAFVASVSDDASLYAALRQLPDLMEHVAVLSGPAKLGGGQLVPGVVIVDPLAMSTEAAVQRLYLAYFKRPADVASLHFWGEAVAHSSVEWVSQKMAQSNEYQDSVKGLGNDQVIDGIYMNLFGHHADSEGQHFYSDVLTTGKASVDQVVRSIIAGAQQQDRELLDNRTIASEIFTTSLDIDQALRLSYAADNAPGKAFIDSINNDASVYAALRGLPTVLQNMTLIGIAPADAGAGTGF